MTHDTSACQRRDTLALDETEYDRVTAGCVTSTFCDVKVALSMIPAEGRHVWQLGCVKEGRGGESNDARQRCGTAHARQDDVFEGCINWHWVHYPSRVWAARCLNEAGWGEADGLSTLDKARMHSSVPLSLNCRAGRLRKMLDWQGTQTHALMVAQTSGRGAVPDRDDWQGPCMCSSPPAASPCEGTGKHVPISKP